MTMKHWTLYVCAIVVALLIGMAVGYAQPAPASSCIAAKTFAEAAVQRDADVVATEITNKDIVEGYLDGLRTQLPNVPDGIVGLMVLSKEGAPVVYVGLIFADGTVCDGKIVRTSARAHAVLMKAAAGVSH